MGMLQKLYGRFYTMYPALREAFRSWSQRHGPSTGLCHHGPSIQTKANFRLQNPLRSHHKCYEISGLPPNRPTTL